MSIVLSCELDRDDLLQLGNNVLPHVEADREQDVAAINRSLAVFDDEVDELDFD